MKNYFFSVSLLLLFILGSCQKELFLDTEPAEIQCMLATPNGNWEIGKPLSDSNYIILQVKVLSAGSYNLVTDSTNGISFAATGQFTAVGNAIVKLSPSGVPRLAGNFRYSLVGLTCPINISFSPMASPAVFTLQSMRDTCGVATIGGNYIEGMQLYNNNKVTLLAIVTVPGAYNISTNNANGISFSAIGNFAATGNGQRIELIGSGTPLQAGTHNFMMNVTPSCSFSIITEAAPVAGSNYLQADISGYTQFFNHALAGTINQDPGTNSQAIGCSGSPNFASNNHLSISFQKRGGLVTTGTYYNFSNVNTSSGISIQYADEYVRSFSQNFNLANSFVGKIDTLTAQRVTGSFSGTIYLNSIGPDSIKITNGKFSVNY